MELAGLAHARSPEHTRRLDANHDYHMEQVGGFRGQEDQELRNRWQMLRQGNNWVLVRRCPRCVPVRTQQKKYEESCKAIEREQVLSIETKHHALDFR